MGVNSYEKTYKKDMTQRYTDLLQLDIWRQQYGSMLAEQQAAYDAGKGYSQTTYEWGEKTVGGEPAGYVQRATGTAFAPSKELQDLGNKIKALEKYDTAEAGKARQAARDLEETKARIAKRKADEAAKRDELRRQRLSAKDVNTTQQGALGE